MFHKPEPGRYPTRDRSRLTPPHVGPLCIVLHSAAAGFSVLCIASRSSTGWGSLPKPAAVIPSRQRAFSCGVTSRVTRPRRLRGIGLGRAGAAMGRPGYQSGPTSVLALANVRRQHDQPDEPITPNGAGFAECGRPPSSPGRVEEKGAFAALALRSSGARLPFAGPNDGPWIGYEESRPLPGRKNCSFADPMF
jgi:hypothetical protein